MAVADQLREIVAENLSEDTTVSWPAVRVLGLLAEQHFLTVVEALERHGECDELKALEATLRTLQSEAGRE